MTAQPMYDKICKDIWTTDYGTKKAMIEYLGSLGFSITEGGAVFNSHDHKIGIWLHNPNRPWLVHINDVCLVRSLNAARKFLAIGLND